MIEISDLSSLSEATLKQPAKAYHALALAEKGKRGRPPGQKKIDEPSPRMKALLQEHGVKTILEAIKDVEKLDKFGSYDAMLIVALGNALKGDETAIENRLNRMFGKVPDKNINLNLNIDATPAELTKDINGLLSDLGEDDSDLIEQ